MKSLGSGADSGNDTGPDIVTPLDRAPDRKASRLLSVLNLFDYQRSYSVSPLDDYSVL